MTESDAPASIGVGGLRSTGHRAKPRRSRGCMPILVILVVVAAIAAFGYVKGVDFIKDQLSDSPAADYSGNGQKPIVTVTVPKGASGRDIGAVLLDAGVVKSVDAFADAYESEPKATSISYGKYELLSKMSAKSALAVLINPDSLIAAPTVTIPEGLRASEILATIAANTDFTPKQLRAAYADTAALDLPAYANGDPEGYLFPSTYDITEDTTAASLLHDMVARFTQNAEDLDLEAKAKSLGEDPGDIVTIASLVQAEAGQADMAKVASVVYNRLDAGMAAAVRLDPALRPEHPRRHPAHPGAAEHRRPVQQLHPGRAATDADRLARRGRARGRAEPREHGLPLLRDRQPGHGRDEVRRDAGGAQPERRGVPGVLHHLRRVLTLG